MSTDLIDPPLEAEDAASPPSLSPAAADATPSPPVALDGGEAEVVDAATTDVLKPLAPGRVAAAAVLSALAACWMAAHVFHPLLTTLAICVLGVLIGGGSVFGAARMRRGGIFYYAALPAALVVAAVITSASGGGSDLPFLIRQTLQQGGLQNPPIPFGPGWRFIAVVLFACLTALAATAGTHLRRPKLAVAVPCLVTLPVALVQPKGQALAPTVGAVVLIVSAMGIAYGADLSGQISTSAGFELRRMVRGGVLLAACVIALVALAQTSFFFPATKQSQVIPPRKPPTPPPLPPDRLLFTVTGPSSVPWRIGVLDSYKGNAFLLPSIDPHRLQHLTGGHATLPPVKATAGFTDTVHVDGLIGQTLPGPGGMTSLDGVKKAASLDPETGLVQLNDEALKPGLTYTVKAVFPPAADQLRTAGEPDPTVLRDYTALPAAPPGVATLLTHAPSKNYFDRLQYVRSMFLSHVVANGSGGPTDITPTQVDTMLSGGQATPYEIVAAQVMLARWAGIPARLGFGFYGGQQHGEQTTFRPVDGSAWLEAYFQGFGWVPLVGTPQKATANLSRHPKEQTKIHATDQLALNLYIPVRELSVQLLYQLVRYYAVRALAIVLPLIAALICYPAILKLARSRRRRKWAAQHGLAAQVMVAYAELRDRAHDLNIGDPRDTPLEFVTAIGDDREHDELAWLVTRALWGDLARDLREEDVRSAEDMARSVTKRVDSAQPALNRFVAWITRTSLRDPWSDELPNVWRARRRGEHARRTTRRLSWARRAFRRARTA